MPTFIAYTFGFVSPGATVGVYMHGFPPDQFAAIDVRAQRSPSRPGAFQPIIEVDTRTAAEHVDGSLAHEIWVTNKSTGSALPSPVVSFAVLLEPLQ